MSSDHQESESKSICDEEDQVWMCGVCDKIMEEKTPGIVCVQCQNWVHLGAKCAKITRKQVSRLKNKFICSNCEDKNKKEKEKKNGKKKRNLICNGFLDFLGMESESCSKDSLDSASSTPNDAAASASTSSGPNDAASSASATAPNDAAPSDSAVAPNDAAPSDSATAPNDAAPSDSATAPNDAASSNSAVTPTSQSASVVNFYIDEGEGMMDGNAKTIQEENLKHGRKRTVNPENWKNTKKRKYSKGCGQKVTGPQCKCRAKCGEKISDEERQKIFEEYCDLRSIDRRRDFHCRYVKQVPVERSRVRNVLKDGRTPNTKGLEDGSRRILTRVYYLGEVKVCKKMYLSTLRISMQTIDTAFEKQGDVVVSQKDNRGGNNKKRTDERELVRQHIKLFPTKHSHYCRKNNNRKYLHEKLSVTKMFKLYQEWMRKQNLVPEKLHMYAEVFNEEFNLSFFKRKKDKCLLCNALENMKLDPAMKRLIFREQDVMKQMEIEELLHYDVSDIDLLHTKAGDKEVLPERGAEEVYIMQKYSEWKGISIEKERSAVLDDVLDEADEDDEDAIAKDLSTMVPEDIFMKWRSHLHNVEITRQMKRDAKDLAKEDETVVYCCFDLQQVLECPYSNVGDMFYKRCLSSYNFVVNDTKNACCFYWSEEHGKRGTNEICTGLIHFAEDKAKEGAKNIIAFADGCGGQNRNRMVAATLSHIVRTTSLNSFFVCYLEKGHTENCADDIHSLIERHKVSDVNCPSEWPILMRQIDTDLNVKVKHFDHSEFYDVHDYIKNFHNFYKNTSGDKVINWQTVKMIKITKADPYIILFKMDYNQVDFEKIDLVQVGGKRGITRDLKSIPRGMKKVYPTRLPIQAAKYDDLMEMCKALVIDEQYHEYYKNIPTC